MSIEKALVDLMAAMVPYTTKGEEIVLKLPPSILRGMCREQDELRRIPKPSVTCGEWVFFGPGDMTAKIVSTTQQV